MSRFPNCFPLPQLLVAFLLWLFYVFVAPLWIPLHLLLRYFSCLLLLPTLIVGTFLFLLDRTTALFYLGSCCGFGSFEDFPHVLILVIHPILSKHYLYVQAWIVRSLGIFHGYIVLQQAPELIYSSFVFPTWLCIHNRQKLCWCVKLRFWSVCMICKCLGCPLMFQLC